jgi:thiol-disulfide isomerase/thioredoxin
LFEASLAQLDDLDPLVRLLGLDYLRKFDAKKAVPILVRLLDDTDPRIVAAAEVNLMHFSGEDFGVRARLAIPPDGSRPGQLDPANAETIRLGVEHRKQWWRVHQKEYSANLSSLPSFAQTKITEASRPPALDFTLPDLNGKSVSLSAFRGKVVLLNFWATWCTACLAEIPDLVALQSKMGNQVAVVGIALDGVPDEDGDSPGEEGEKSQKAGASLKTVRTKVERAVKARRINYAVLLDPKGSVGGQYNGGELPTTVIIDAEGRVRRRFIGERNLTVFEAMLAEASKPITPSGTNLLVNGD